MSNSWLNRWWIFLYPDYIIIKVIYFLCRSIALPLTWETRVDLWSLWTTHIRKLDTIICRVHKSKGASDTILESLLGATSLITTSQTKNISISIMFFRLGPFKKQIKRGGSKFLRFDQLIKTQIKILSL